jgi:hypothetical protein
MHGPSKYSHPLFSSVRALLFFVDFVPASLRVLVILRSFCDTFRAFDKCVCAYPSLHFSCTISHGWERQYFAVLSFFLSFGFWFGFLVSFAGVTGSVKGVGKCICARLNWRTSIEEVLMRQAFSVSLKGWPSCTLIYLSFLWRKRVLISSKIIVLPPFYQCMWRRREEKISTFNPITLANQENMCELRWSIFCVVV